MVPSSELDAVRESRTGEDGDVEPSEDADECTSTALLMGTTRWVPADE
ncbi:hypothetical protein ACFXAS_17830 [Streptomyces sp. NPDC059459]